MDVFTGQRYNATSAFDFAVASGLKQGDPIFNGWSNVTILSAQAFTCGGVSRPTVGTQYSPPYGAVVRVIWDQSTGVLCSYALSDVQGRTLQLNMINSTIWNQPAAVDPFAIGLRSKFFSGYHWSQLSCSSTSDGSGLGNRKRSPGTG
jgi:hypothetical protein